MRGHFQGIYSGRARLLLKKYVAKHEDKISLRQHFRECFPWCDVGRCPLRLLRGISQWYFRIMIENASVRFLCMTPWQGRQRELTIRFFHTAKKLAMSASDFLSFSNRPTIRSFVRVPSEYPCDTHGYSRALLWCGCIPNPPPLVCLSITMWLGGRLLFGHKKGSLGLQYDVLKPCVFGITH